MRDFIAIGILEREQRHQITGDSRYSHGKIMRLREVKAPLLKNTGAYKTNIGGIPNIQAAVDHHRVILGSWRVGAGAHTEGTKHQRNQNQRLKQTFKFHGHFSLWKYIFKNQYKVSISYCCISSPNSFPTLSQSLQRILVWSKLCSLNTFTLYDPHVDYYVTVELPPCCKIVAKEKLIADAN
jgi:hypothetical protein